MYEFLKDFVYGFLSALVWYAKFVLLPIYAKSVARAASSVATTTMLSKTN